MDFVIVFIDVVEIVGGVGIDVGDMVIVVGKVFVGWKVWGFVDDLVVFDD